VTTRLLSEAWPAGTRPDAVVVGILEGRDEPELALGAGPVDDALGGTLLSALKALGATGKAEEVTKVATGALLESAPAALVIAVGLGELEPRRAKFGREPAYHTESLRRGAGAAVRSLLEGPAKPVQDHEGNRREPPSEQLRITVALPARDEAEAEAAALGSLLGGYSFPRYRTTKFPPPSVEIRLADDGMLGEAARERVQAISDAVTLVRDLVNTGPSDLVPATLAAEAERVAAAHRLDVEVLDEKALAEGGYGGILAVGQGSMHPPRLVRLGYRHPDATKTVVFAGKGITFDSGGLSLKPSSAMEHMKSDMAGAAAVLGTLQAISVLRPAVNVIGYMAIAENMPGGHAQRPADVITIYGGKTVEVLNTDAEGRLVLADALARSVGDSPDLLVDIATLTGSQGVALGRRTAGVMANNDEARAGIVEAARQVGETFWPMPLPEDLREGLESGVADMTNITPDRFGGMLVGGLFLREFVPSRIRWAHMDIASPAFNDSSPHGYTPRGGTGVPVRTLVQIVRDVADGRL
jgi:leucyl aminopeptidase